MLKAMAMFLKFARHWVLRADSLARANTGNSMAARMPMMAMTTNSSMRVKPLRLLISERPPRDNEIASMHLSTPQWRRAVLTSFSGATDVIPYEARAIPVARLDRGRARPRGGEYNRSEADLRGPAYFGALLSSGTYLVRPGETSYYRCDVRLRP